MVRGAVHLLSECRCLVDIPNNRMLQYDPETAKHGLSGTSISPTAIPPTENVEWLPPSLDPLHIQNRVDGTVVLVDRYQGSDS